MVNLFWVVIIGLICFCAGILADEAVTKVKQPKRVDWDQDCWD